MIPYFRASRQVISFLSILSIISILLYPVSAAAEAITVPVPIGTQVNLKFTGAVSPETFSVGQQVELTVDAPVKVNGETVVEYGAKAYGEVVQAQKRGGVGKQAIIAVILKRVTAVDGSMIPIEGRLLVEGKNKQTSSILITVLCCILGLLQKGGEAVIAAGTLIQGTTMAEVNVAVTKPDLNR